jgi:hypothetical protein
VKTLVSLTMVAVVFGSAGARAQSPAPPAPSPEQPAPAAAPTQPSSAPPPSAPPSYPPTQPAYPNNYPQTYPQTYPRTYPPAQPADPTYPSPSYSGYVAPPPPPPEKGRGCCLWSIRYDPFDLIWRRITFAAEVAWGKLPLSIELTPKYIFNAASDDVKETGFDMGVNIAWYPGGKALKGLWVKAHAEYETFRTTLTRKGADDAPIGKPNPDLCDPDSATGTCSKRVSSAILGLMVGSSYVFGSKNGGFAISGGIGIGAALATAKDLEVVPCTAADVAAKSPHCSAAEDAGAAALSYRYYGDAARIRLLGTLGLGIAF